MYIYILYPICSGLFCISTKLPWCSWCRFGPPGLHTTDAQERCHEGNKKILGRFRSQNAVEASNKMSKYVKKPQ